MIARAGTSFSLAMVVTFGLFFFMQQMISTPEIRLSKDFGPGPVIITDVEPPRPPQEKIRKPERPEPAPVTPEPKFTPQPSTSKGFTFNPEVIGEPVLPGLPEHDGVGFADGEVYAITAVAPEYPVSAARQGLSGYVVVGFTVDKRGAVIDAYVIESSSRLFEKSALRAISKFKYKPKVVSGTPVAQGNLMYKFTYELQDDA